MSKVRVCPVILTDGFGTVKGKSFNSWRTVGSVTSSVQLFEARDVDEIFLLDVRARSRGETVSEKLVAEIANNLRLPLTVGGGIDSLSQISRLLDLGADRVVLGTGAFLNSELISSSAKFFGSQAIVCAIDYDESVEAAVFLKSGTLKTKHSLLDSLARISGEGAGEVLLQSIIREGSFSGFDLHNLRLSRQVTDIPITISGGYGQPQDAVDAVRLGASAIAIGSAFQFRAVTPMSVKRALRVAGERTRV